jgi:hypothetical protein
MKTLDSSALRVVFFLALLSGCAYLPRSGDRLVLRRDPHASDRGGDPVRPLGCEGGVVKLEYWDAQGLYTGGFVSILPLGGQLCGGATNSFRSAMEGREYAEPVAREAEERLGQEFRHSPEEIEAFIAKWTEGYQGGATARPSGAAPASTACAGYVP